MKRNESRAYAMSRDANSLFTECIQNLFIRSVPVGQESLDSEAAITGFTTVLFHLTLCTCLSSDPTTKH